MSSEGRSATAPTTEAAPATTQPLHGSTQPTSAPTDDDRRGDVFHSVAQTIQQTGLPQTVAATPVVSWLMLGLCTLLGILAARMLVRIYGELAVKRISQGRMVRSVLINSFAGPIGLFVFELGFGTGLTFIRLTAEQKVVLRASFQLANVVVVGWLLYNLVDLVALALTRWSRGRQGKLSAMLVPLVRKMLRGVVVIVFVLFAADNIFDVHVGTILAGLGLVGLAVSLAAQDSLKNLFGSITLFADGPFSIGDVVRVDPHEGVVEDIGFRSTRIRTADGFVVSIPNGTVANAAILNMSRRPAIRRTIELTLPAATTSVTRLRETLSILRGILAQPDVADAIDAGRETPRVIFDDLKTDAHRIRVIYRFRGNDQAAYLAHAERVNLAIVERLGASGIAFASDTAASAASADSAKEPHA